MPQDTTAPVVEALNLSYQADQNRFYITGRIVDDISGFNYANIYIRNPSDTVYKSTSLTLNNTTGLYEGYIDLNAYSENGRWEISYIEAADIAGNRTSYFPDHPNYPQNISGSLTVTGNLNDTTAPVVETLNLSYQADENRFYITARIIDDASGLDYAYLSCQNPSNDRL